MPPLPRMPTTHASLSNYSLNRHNQPSNINNLNYYHLGPQSANTPESPYQTTLSMPISKSLHPGYHNAQVKMLPSPEDWADNTTVTGGMSDLGVGENLMGNGFRRENNVQTLPEMGWMYLTKQYIGLITIRFLSVTAFLSPILMVVIPQLNIINLRNSQLKCEVDCDGILISFSFKLLFLLIGSWAVFYRRPRTSLPRINIIRSILTLLLFILLFTYWLFYSVRIVEQRRKIQYSSLVKYATNLLDTLLAIHYLAIILLELQHLIKPQFQIKIVRSPDGESRCFSIGKMSIQNAASHVLDFYYTQFPIYNPYMEQIPSNNKDNNYKYYDIDGMGNYGEKGTSRVSSPVYGGSTKKYPGHNERFYEEYEYERRLKKRRAKLITATEEAFTHIKRIHTDQIKGPINPLDSYETAQSIFPSIARPLQKYLRITRQQPRHTMDSILHHLATIVMYDMSPMAFLEKFFITSPVLQNEQEQAGLQNWSLICDILLTRGLEHRTVFQLRQGDVLLLCEVFSLPDLNITENIKDQTQDKFVIQGNVQSSPA